LLEQFREEITVADGENLDSVVRRALGEAAEPADSAGVADAIRARVASGDLGVAATASTAPGWGGLGALGWLPWIGVVVAAGIVGGTLGATGYLGGPSSDAPVESSVIAVTRTVDARSCVGGDVVATLAADTRVLAVLRSDDERWAGVRSPSALGETVWIPVSTLTPDDGQPSVSDLPVGGACPVIEALDDSPARATSEDPDDVTPDPAPDPNPDPDPAPPPPPSDTTPPTVQQLSVDVNGCPAVIQAVAADNVGVTQVTLSWSGVAAGSGAMSLVSGTWRYLYDSENLPEGNMTFTAIARDAAGNASAPAVTNVYMVCVL